MSLVPAGTEIAYALGSGDDLVAVTHDCDYPPAARALPRVTSSTIAPGSDGFAIDAQVRAAVERGESTFHLDAAALAAARPDVLLGQTLCAVCAVTVAQLPAAMDPAPAVVPLDGQSLEGIFADIARVGDALHRADRARALVAQLRSRIARVERHVEGAARPGVVCLEWLAPLFNAGHWVPEQVRLAGGLDVLGTAGERSREIAWDEVRAARPDVVIAMPCGWDATRAAREAETLGDLDGARLFGVDGAAYFSRPGPRLVDGVELLASILHPGLAAPPAGALAIEVPAAV